MIYLAGFHPESSPLPGVPKKNLIKLANALLAIELSNTFFVFSLDAEMNFFVVQVETANLDQSTTVHLVDSNACALKFTYNLDTIANCQNVFDFFLLQ